MKKNIAIIILITLFTKALGFVREIVLTYFFGATAISDVYLIAQTIPTTLFALVGTGLATTFIPIFSKVETEEGEENALRFTSNVMNLVLVICSVLIVIVLIFTPQVVKVFARGFRGETLSLAVTFTRISILGIYFTSLVYILNAYLQLKDEFIIPALISLPMNLVLIMFYAAASKFGNILLGYGLFFSILIQFIFILPSVMKNRFKYYALLSHKNRYVREMLILAVPVIIGTSVNQLNVLVDKNIASTIIEGGISALNYADRLSGLVYGLFVIPIITVIFPTISKMVVEHNEEGMNKVVNESLVSMGLLIIPASVGAMVLARPIVEFLFLRGEFDVQAAVLTSQALFYYAISMLAYGVRDVFTRVFYASNDTKTPTINGVVGVATNIVLNLILSRFMGIAGLALATSISAIFTAVLLYISLKKKSMELSFKSSLMKMIKITGAALLMGALAKFSYPVFLSEAGSSLGLIFSIVVAGALYFLLIWLFKIEEVEKLKDIVKNKLKNRN